VIPQDVPGVVHRLQESLLLPDYAEYVQALAESAAEEEATYGMPTSGGHVGFEARHSIGARHTQPGAGWSFTHGLSDRLNICRLFHVSEAMAAVARQAAEQLPEGITWELHSFPSWDGIMFFGRPLILLDVWNRPVNIAAVTWTFSHTGVANYDGRPGWVCTLLSDRRDLRDYYFAVAEESGRHEGIAETTRLLGDLLVFEMTWLPVGQPIGHWIGDNSAAIAQFRKEHIGRMPGGEIPEWDHNGPPNTINLGRINYAVFRLMEQELADVSDYEDRRLARRNRGKRRPPHAVTVIELRRRHHYGQYQEGTGTFLTYRSVTSGHWRNQPYGKGRQEVKRIWIHPYVRGPEGAPFHQSTKVNALKR
jgi:hypothetical protein